MIDRAAAKLALDDLLDAFQGRYRPLGDDIPPYGGVDHGDVDRQAVLDMRYRKLLKLLEPTRRHRVSTNVPKLRRYIIKTIAFALRWEVIGKGKKPAQAVKRAIECLGENNIKINERTVWRWYVKLEEGEINLVKLVNRLPEEDPARRSLVWIWHLETAVIVYAAVRS